MSGRHGGARTARRGPALLMAVATVLGLWFGVSAPDVSPVAPVPAAQVQPPDVPGVVPAVPPAVPGPQRGGRR